MKNFARWFARFCAVALLLSLLVNCQAATVVVGIIYLLLFLFVTYDLTDKHQPDIAAAFFVGYFSIGHLLKTAVMLFNKESHDAHGWLGIGNFNFSFHEMCELFFVQICGLIGVFFAYRFFTDFFQNRSPHPSNRAIIKPSQENLLIVAWFLCEVLINYTMFHLNLGRHGMTLTEEEALPFRLGGLMIYLRDLVIPAFGFALMDALSQLENRKKFYCVAVLAVIIGIGVSLISLHRSTMIGKFVPILYFLFFLTPWHNRFRLNSANKMLMVILVILVTILVGSLVNVHRSQVYTHGQAQLSDSLDSFLAGSGIETNLIGIQTFIDRIEGSRELMAVISCNIKSVGTFWAIFLGEYPTVNEDIYGFSLISSGRSYGTTLGMLGLLYTSGSFLLVFAGTFIYFFMVLAIENKFISYGFRIAAVFFTLAFFGMVWANMVWFFLIRFGFSLLLLYIITTHFMKPGKIKHRPQLKFTG